jgi:predicted porin
MKKAKLLLIAICGVFITNNLKAQAFEQGNIVVTVGYGVPNFGKALLSTVDESIYTNYDAKGFGPLHFRAEYGVGDKFGIGLNVNFNTFGAEWKYDDTFWSGQVYTYEEKLTAINFIPHFKFHYLDNDNLDLYSGFGIGYSIFNYTRESNDPNDIFLDSWSSPIAIGVDITAIGVRYYFTDNIGAYVEAGYAKSLINFGLAAKF